jgi:hypothetical protein
LGRQHSTPAFFPYVLFAGFESVSKNELEHGPGRATGITGEALQAVLLRGGKCERSHALWFLRLYKKFRHRRNMDVRSMAGR